MYNKENLLKTSGEKMQQIEADPLPKSGVRKKKMKNPTTLALSPSVARNGLSTKQNFSKNTILSMLVI